MDQQNNLTQAQLSIDRKEKYIELIEKGSKISETIENQNVVDTFNTIMELVDVCENVSGGYVQEGRIENTKDYLMDASILKMSHDLVGNTTEKIAGSDFREDEYIIALQNIMGSENPELLNDYAMECCRTMQSQLSLLGVVDFEVQIEVKEKKERHRQKSQLGPKKAPETITQVVKKEKGAEKINIMRAEIQRVCEERKTDTLPYYELIINPHSFMKSVDAAFMVSFLVRDNILGLKRMNDEPFIFLHKPSPFSANSSRRNQVEDTVQTVMSITPELWKEQTQKYNLKTPVLKLERNNAVSSDSDESD